MSSLAILHSRASHGIYAPSVVVEAHISSGLPSFSIVGLPETAVKESRDRVRSALLNTHFKFPNGRIIVNLAPADLPKDGGRFDLPIALGILAATGQIPPQALVNIEFAGELALSGELRPIHGALPFDLATQRAGRQLIIPQGNAEEAGLLSEGKVFPARHLLEVCSHLLGEKLLSRHITEVNNSVESAILLELADVRGQYGARRALEVAAAGQHSLLLIGPPGTGKTMLATRLPGILPAMTEAEALETTAIASLNGKGFDHQHWRQRPFRAPHHTASSPALVGGGNPPKPGEISLAHQGVLFLDELPEFNRKVLETLREPLESGHITISRASYQTQFPAKFQFIAAMNPCPCGYLGCSSDRCQCSQEQIRRYQSRISGPLLDRLDIHVRVPSLPKGLLGDSKQLEAENSITVRTRVKQARERQQARQQVTNAMLPVHTVKQHCAISTADHALLDQVVEKFGLSARAHHRILKVARTIADLAGCEHIDSQHLTESVGYRCLDRQP